MQHTHEVPGDSPLLPQPSLPCPTLLPLSSPTPQSDESCATSCRWGPGTPRPPGTWLSTPSPATALRSPADPWARDMRGRHDLGPRARTSPRAIASATPASPALRVPFISLYVSIAVCLGEVTALPCRDAHSDHRKAHRRIVCQTTLPQRPLVTSRPSMCTSPSWSAKRGYLREQEPPRGPASARHRPSTETATPHGTPRACAPRRQLV